MFLSGISSRDIQSHLNKAFGGGVADDLEERILEAAAAAVDGEHQAPGVLVSGADNNLRGQTSAYFGGLQSRRV
jgi:hypothetical protein